MYQIKGNEDDCCIYEVIMYESSGFPMFLFVKIDMFFVFWYLHMIVTLLG